jgi:peroxiredoxin
MKNFWLITVLLLIFQACGDDSNRFAIEGKLDNAGGEELYLMELTSDGTNTLDSTKVDQEGNFRFTGYTSVARFLLVRSTPRKSVTLVVEPGDDIQLQGNLDNLGRTYQVEGSEGSREIMNMRRRLDQTIASLDSLGRIYRENRDSENAEAIQSRLNKESRRIVREHKDYTKDFIDRNLNSLSSMMALYQQIGPRNYVLDPRKDFRYFEKVDSALMANYPNSEPVKRLHSQVEEIRKKMEARKANKTRLSIGSKAPEIALPTPQGDTVRLSDLRGEYVLLDFWAAWCKPCRVENPNLVKAYDRYHGKGFEIYQVSLDRDRDAWVKAIEKDNLDWYHVSDLQHFQSAAAQKYNINAIPANFLLNPEGVIIDKNLRGDALQAKLNEIFSGQ